MSENMERRDHAVKVSMDFARSYFDTNEPLNSLTPLFFLFSADLEKK